MLEKNKKKNLLTIWKISLAQRFDENQASQKKDSVHAIKHTEWVNHNRRLTKSWNKGYSVMKYSSNIMNEEQKQGLTLASPLSDIITSPAYC
jgi:hypothetical protein